MSEIELKSVKSRSSFMVVGGLLFLFFSFAAYRLYYNHQTLPVDPTDQTLIDIRVPDSSSARQVAAILKENNLVHSDAIFLNYCRENNLDNQLKAGHYRLRRSQSLQEIAEIISEGKVVSLTITIPEGYTAGQIGDLLVKKGICTKEQWQQALSADYDFKFLRDIPKGSNRLEGLLFPDTYCLDEDPTAEQIVTAMLSNFNQVWNQEFAQPVSNKKLDMYQTIIIASMIEKEAKIDAERKTISGVIQNRLKADMPLQICATVIYCLGGHKETVTYQDLQVDSPYNTYKYKGLPPGPICCPGKASIAAAIDPQKHSYYYYLSKGDGSHYFSRTYAEHLQAKAKYIK